MHSQNNNLLSSRLSLDCLSLPLPDEAATIAVGQKLAPLLLPGMVFWLNGDLGAGKTTLVRAVLRGLGFSGAVKSPTYTLVEVYVVSSLYLYHFDFYRFNEPGEFADAGLGEYFQNEGICLVEWPEKAVGYVPEPDVVLSLQFASDNEMATEPGRILLVEAYSEMGLQCLNKFKGQISNAVN